MVRFIAFVVVAIVINIGAAKLAEYLGITVDRTSYIFGLAVMSVIGFVWFLVTGWWSTAMTFFQPQMVHLPTQNSPFQVTAAAGVGCFFFLVAMAAMLFVLYLKVTGAI